MVRVTVHGAQSSWVVKLGRQQDAFDPADPAHVRSWGFFPDLVGAAFVSALGGQPPLAPRFVGADPRAGVIALEDLGTVYDLASILLGTDPRSARDGLLELARVLGRLHARATGREADYQALWRQYAGTSHPPAAGWRVSDGVQVVREVAANLEVPIGAAAEDDLTVLAAALDDRALRTYVHGDPCPDNVRSAPDARLFDFQAGGFGLALLDGVYARMPFPTCWCTGRMPREAVVGFEASYREELAEGLPAARDEQVFHRALVAACAHWFVAPVRWRLPRALATSAPPPPQIHRGWLQPDERGHVLLRADAFVGAAREFGHLEALADFAARLADRLRQRWRSGLHPLPVYPAFAEPEEDTPVR